MKEVSPTRTAVSDSMPAIHPHSAFVGRARESEILRSAVTGLLAGRGGLVMLAGEPGIGKTRLAEESANYAIAKGSRVIWGRCWEGGGAPAFWPWIQLIRESVHAFSDSMLAEAGSGLSCIAQMVPELRLSTAAVEPGRNPVSAWPLAEDSMAAGPERFRLFDAVTALFKQLAANTPLMMVLDDLHAADEDSLMLLRFLARDLKQTHILMVATYREVELRQSRAHSTLLSEISREGSTILLRGLSVDEVADFIGLNSRLGADESTVSSLYHATDGNPFFLDEIVRLIVAERNLGHSISLDSGFTVPDSVRTIIRRRIAPFAEQTKSVMTIASLIGKEFDLALLAEVTGISIEQLIESLEQAAANSLIVEVTETFGCYRFAHEVIRETLRTELGKTASARLHQRIAAAIEELNSRDLEPHLARLAHHYVEALPLGTAAKAVEYARRGGERARKELAFAEASRLYAIALRALDSVPRRDEVQRCEVLLAMGETQAQGRSLREARHSFERAADIARNLGRTDLLAQTALSLSAWFGGFFNKGRPLIGVIAEVLSSMDPGDTAVRATLTAKLGGEHYWTGEREKGLSLCQEAVAMARRIGDPRALVSALWDRSQISWGPENVEGRLATATEIATLAESIGDYQCALRAREMRFTALLEIGDMAGIDAEVRAYAALAEKSGEQFGIVERFHAALALSRGDFELAERKTRELSRHAQRRQDPALLACASYLTEILGRERDGIDLAQFEGLRKARIARSLTTAAVFRIELAIFFTAIGRRAEALAEMGSLERNNFAAIPRDWNWLYNMCGLATLCVGLRDAQRAAAVYELLLPYANRNVTAGWGDLAYGCSSRFLGMLAGVIDRANDAQAHFEQALEFDDRMGSRPWAAYARYEYARVLLNRGNQGDLEHALKLLTEAREITSAIGMKPLGGRVNSLIAKAQAPKSNLAAATARPPAGANTGEHSQRVIATILFIDIVSSTEHVTELKDRRWVELRARFFESVRKELASFGGREINTAGDGMFAIFDRPDTAIHCAFAMSDGAQKIGLQIRAGIHTGECELVGGDAVGIAVHIGARVAGCAAATEVMVSSTVRDLLAGGDISFTDRGSRVLKGILGEWRLYAVQPIE